MREWSARFLLEDSKEKLRETDTFSKVEADAHLQWAKTIYDLAAGAAVLRGKPRRVTKALVGLRQDIEDILLWNIYNPTLAYPMKKDE